MTPPLTSTAEAVTGDGQKDSSRFLVSSAAGVFIHPTLQGRMSMTPEMARAIRNHPQAKLIPDWCMDEARAVEAAGERIWWRG